VDIFPEIPGVEFEACWANCVELLIDAQKAVKANFISVKDLIAAKVASGRQQDIADIEAIKRAQQVKSKT
jgi:hypothetical protein